MTESSQEEILNFPIVFFDGVCGLCNHAVKFLMSRDSRGVLKFAPLQGTTAEQLIPPDIRQNLNTFVFADSGRLHYRSTAMVRILMRIGGLWGLVGTLLWLIPWPLRDVGYRCVSRIRYRMFGKHDSCRLPSPEERNRFFD